MCVKFISVMHACLGYMLMTTEVRCWISWSQCYKQLGVMGTELRSSQSTTSELLSFLSRPLNLFLGTGEMAE